MPSQESEQPACSQEKSPYGKQSESVATVSATESGNSRISNNNTSGQKPITPPQQTHGNLNETKVPLQQPLLPVIPSSQTIGINCGQATNFVDIVYPPPPELGQPAADSDVVGDEPVSLDDDGADITSDLNELEDQAPATSSSNPSPVEEKKEQIQHTTCKAGGDATKALDKKAGTSELKEDRYHPYKRSKGNQYRPANVPLHELIEKNRTRFRSKPAIRRFIPPTLSNHGYLVATALPRFDGIVIASPPVQKDGAVDEIWSNSAETKHLPRHVTAGDNTFRLGEDFHKEYVWNELEMAQWNRQDVYGRWHYRPHQPSYW